MRKQYHPMKGEDGLRVWDVDRLLRLSAELPTRRVPLSEIWELDDIRWFDTTGERPTCRAVLEHMRLVLASDTVCPGRR